MMNSDVAGLVAPPGMRPYMPGSGGLPNFGMPGMEDPLMMAQDNRMMGLDASVGQMGNLGPFNGRQDFIGRQETPIVQTAPGLLPPDASPTLYVEGIPADCKRREAAHIFRPFIGYKEVRLVQKEARRPGGDPLVLCFVDFVDARCAATALEALQGYKLDETVRDSPSLRLQFARVPGPRGGPPRDHFGARHDNVFWKG